GSHQACGREGGHHSFSLVPWGAYPTKVLRRDGAPLRRSAAEVGALHNSNHLEVVTKLVTTSNCLWGLSRPKKGKFSWNQDLRIMPTFPWNWQSGSFTTNTIMWMSRITSRPRASSSLFAIFSFRLVFLRRTGFNTTF